MMYDKEATYLLNGYEKRAIFPNDFMNLRNQIKELFSLNDEKLNCYNIIYIEDNKKFYIKNENTFNKPKLTSFSKVFYIEPKININNYFHRYPNKRDGRGNFRRIGGRRIFNERVNNGYYQRNNISNQRENYNNNSEFHNLFSERNDIGNQLYQNNNINSINAPLIENLNNFNKTEKEENNENSIIPINEEKQYEKEIEYEKTKIKEDFNNKYLKIIEYMEVLFDFMITQEDIINIIKSLLSSPHLTIFEGMNLIFREAEIIKTLCFINIEKRDFNSIKYNKSDNLEPIRKYKIFDKSKTLQKHWLFIDDTDKRRVLVKDENGYYNYIPLLNINSKKDLYAKNENEVLYHYLFYKTLLCKQCDLSNSNEKEIELCPYANNILKDFRIIYNNKDEKIIEFIQLLNYSNLFHFKNYLEYLPINCKKNIQINNCPYNERCINNHLCPFFHYSIKENEQNTPFIFNGINLDEKNNSKEDKKEETLNVKDIEEYVEKIEEIKKIKEKIDKFVFVGKGLICRKCNIISNDGKICFFIKCKHFLCYKCIKKITIEKKENNKKSFLLCPFCGEEIKKDEIVLLNF